MLFPSVVFSQEKITEDDKIKLEWYLLKGQSYGNEINRLLSETEKLERNYKQYIDDVYKRYNKDKYKYQIDMNGNFVERKEENKSLTDMK